MRKGEKAQPGVGAMKIIDNVNFLQGDELKDFCDYRESIRPKHPLPDADFVPHRYYQVYEHKLGFLPNMSILDLLFNEGNESILHLI